MNNPIYRSPIAHSSNSTPFEKDFAHDLPENLLIIGWRKFWSKRENREYYYNKITGKSLWDLEELKEEVHENNLNKVNEDSLGSLKRKIDVDTEEGGIIKKNFINNVIIKSEQCPGPVFVPGSLYNFSYPSYMPLIRGRRPQLSVFLPAHPFIEMERSNLLNKLRNQFVNSCETRENIQPPEGSFNRWLLQMKITDCGSDPIFPSHCDIEIGSSMKRELLLSLPFPIVKPKYLHLAKAQLMRYAESVKGLVERRNASPPCRKIIKHNVEETLRWIRSDDHRTFDDYIEKLANLKRICHPHLQELVRESVENICIKMYHLSQEYATQLRIKHIKLIRQSGIQLPEVLINEINLEHSIQSPLNDILQQSENKLLPNKTDETNDQELLPPHPLSLACPCQLFLAPNTQPTVMVKEESNTTDLKRNFLAVEIHEHGEFNITKYHFEKLEALYALNTKDDPQKVAFHIRLWCLLQRYYSYLGCENGSFAGVINQAALPIPVFETLNRLFDVNFELFASPLNCYFSQYCSAFHDTDRYFGSCGPALEFFPVTGSFEANPPFCEELLLGFVNHVEKILRHSSLPLSFIIFIPDWRDPPFEALTHLESSAFNRHQISLRAREHEYRIANFPPNLNNVLTSDKIEPPEMLKRSGHSTLMVFLQNDAGHKKWTPTKERLHELLGVYYSSTVSNIRNRRDLDEEYVNSVS